MWKTIRGNARTCVVMEPLFVIPSSMYTTYASVYMLHLHVTTTGLGWLTTLGLILQIFTSFISGYLTDRLGRRTTLWVFDVFSWTIGTLLWAFSHNFWWFLIATFVNSLQRIPATAWYCLLVEDTPVDRRTAVFTGLQVVSVIGGLFAPLGGLLVSHFSIVMGTRIMYAFACVSMSAMIYFRHLGLHETEIGIRKMQERRHADFGKELGHYLDILKRIFRNRTLLLLFAVYVLWNVQTTIRSTFLSVYQVGYLHLSASWISLFPAASSVAMIVFLGLGVRFFREEHAKSLMNVGFILMIAASLLLIVAPIHGFFWVLVSTLMAAIGTIIANPYVESVVANAIDDEHRATMLSVLNVLILVFTSPSGIIGGWSYGVDPRLTMWLVVATFAISILLVLGASATEKVSRLQR